MRYLCLLIFFLLISCKTEREISQEQPFSFIGTWDYDQKFYQFDTPPYVQTSYGKDCNGKTNFIFRPDEFEIVVFDGTSCQNQFYYVLEYELTKKNDSTHIFTSNRLIRSNYNPSGQIDITDIPLIEGSVELIVRSTDEFITYLNLPEESLFQGRSYTSSYIRYRRIQN